jgi:RNA polymerase sigma-70 factor (ECF subfamily)
MADKAQRPEAEESQTPPGVEAMVRAAQAGDAQAWTLLVRAYAPRVYAMVQSRTRNTTVSEEITQAVMATLALQLRGGSYAEEGRFESWLFRIAMNRVRDHVRMLRRRGTSLSLEHVQAMATTAHAPEVDEGPTISRVLAAALDTLGDADREVIELRHHAGLGFRDIAQLLDEPLGTLLARHHRALAKLRATLERTHPGIARMVGSESMDDTDGEGNTPQVDGKPAGVSERGSRRPRD